MLNILKKLYLLLRRSSHIIIQLVAIDQFTKWLCIGYLRKTPGLVLKVTSFLDMAYSWNYGISFGIFRHYYQYSNAFFIVINSGVIVFLWSILLRSKSITSFVGYSLVIGGALGNLIDRLINGAVFDFIYFHYQEYGFPIFNLADSFISIGVLFLINDYYKSKKTVEVLQKAIYDEAKIANEAEQIRQASDNHSINSKAE